MQLQRRAQQCPGRSQPQSIVDVRCRAVQRYASSRQTAAGRPRLPCRGVARVQAFKAAADELKAAPAQLNGGLTPVAAKGKKKAVLGWAGAGVFFFWQLGAMKFLAEKYDLTKLPMAGASGGALASVLAACGVSADRVLEYAYEMSLKYNVWDRSMGLFGVWGQLIEEWMDKLLPEDAAERCRGRVSIVVTQLPSLKQVAITDFEDKKDLINCAMASSHIPMVLDMKLARKCRGVYCVDGSFPDFFTNKNSDLLMAGGDATMFDYFEDPALERKGRLDMLKLRSYDEFKRIMSIGYAYAQRLYEEGHFDHFELKEVDAGLSVDQELQLLPKQDNGMLVEQPLSSFSDDSYGSLESFEPQYAGRK